MSTPFTPRLAIAGLARWDPSGCHHTIIAAGYTYLADDHLIVTAEYIGNVTSEAMALGRSASDGWPRRRHRAPDMARDASFRTRADGAAVIAARRGQPSVRDIARHVEDGAAIGGAWRACARCPRQYRPGPRKAYRALSGR